MDEKQAVEQKGWKTNTAAGIMILIALAGAALHFIAPDSDYAMPLEAAGLLAAKGLAVFGLGHKLQKLIEAFKK